MKFEQEAAETLELLRQASHVLDFHPIGSAWICDNPNDIDFLVLVKGESFFPFNEIEDGVRWSFGGDWSLCGGEYDIEEASIWGAIRKGPVNLILTIDPDWFRRTKVANEVCLALKLQDKDDRIVVFRVVRDGYSANDANARRDGSA